MPATGSGSDSWKPLGLSGGAHATVLRPHSLALRCRAGRPCRAARRREGAAALTGQGLIVVVTSFAVVRPVHSSIWSGERAASPCGGRSFPQARGGPQAFEEHALARHAEPLGLGRRGGDQRGGAPDHGDGRRRRQPRRQRKVRGLFGEWLPLHGGGGQRLRQSPQRQLAICES